MQVELKDGLSPCRAALVMTGLLSALTNVLALTGSIFMLVIYDKVIPSGSVPTLVSVALVALAFYAFQAFVDIVRSRVLTRIGLVLREALSARVFDIVVRKAARGDGNASGVVGHFDKIGSFVSSAGLVALFDLPWIPIYLALCFAFHLEIGLSVLCGAIVLVCITLLGEVITRRAAVRMNDAMGERQTLLASVQRNADSIQAMGMTSALLLPWTRLGDGIGDLQRNLADRLAVVSTATRTIRMALQSFVLAVGAYLVIRQEATGGIMIASSILSSRALAPVELAIGQWKGFVAARLSWAHLSEALDTLPLQRPSLPLPRPGHVLSCERLVVSPPGSPVPTLRDVNFILKAGDAVAVIGPTGSGKSTLAKVLAGTWTPLGGTVRLDGMAIERWAEAERGRIVGYLSQQVALFDGTIADNISRFDPGASTAKILAAAGMAGVHEMVARLPEGYDTQLGRLALSGGQAQRICLARALYGDPFLLILDEPNSNLDDEGDLALQRALKAARSKGSVVVVVAHRPSVLASVSHLAVMSEGRLLAFGPKEDVLRRLPGLLGGGGVAGDQRTAS